jgi:hypothetical protein
MAPCWASPCARLAAKSLISSVAHRLMFSMLLPLIAASLRASTSSPSSAATRSCRPPTAAWPSSAAARPASAAARSAASVPSSSSRRCSLTAASASRAARRSDLTSRISWSCATSAAEACARPCASCSRRDSSSACGSERQAGGQMRAGRRGKTTLWHQAIRLTQEAAYISKPPTIRSPHHIPYPLSPPHL